MIVAENFLTVIINRVIKLQRFKINSSKELSEIAILDLERLFKAIKGILKLIYYIRVSKTSKIIDVDSFIY